MDRFLSRLIRRFAVPTRRPGNYRAGLLRVECLEDRLVLAPQILLTPTVLANLKQEAAANTTQWQIFKARLDSQLAIVTPSDIGAYFGSELPYVSDYALGYQILKDSDPLTAADYADKAIGLMKSGVNDLQISSEVATQFLARGDGTRTTFVLPNADLLPSTLNVSTSDVTSRAVVHGTANGQDALDSAGFLDGGNYQVFLKVSNTADGPANYAQGADWRHNPDYANNTVDWSSAGLEPAPGATYFLTAASNIQTSTVTNYTLSGQTITFAQAPAANKAIFVQYVYGTHSANGSTLAYQETSAGDGGFNSIYGNDTYPSRYLGKHLAMGIDWLDGYVGFTPAFEQQVATMLVRWADYLSTANSEAYAGYNGYDYVIPASNYGAGSYDSLVMTGLALNGRNPDGARLLNEALAYRQQYILPTLQNLTDSLKGGYWSEGWNYGHNSVENLILPARALEAAGVLTATAEHQWSNEVIDELASEQPAPGMVYDGGQDYEYPFHLLNKSLFLTLSDMASNAAEKSYANYYLHNYPDSAFRDQPPDIDDYRNLLFDTPGAPASYWSALPLQKLATGTGLLTARSDWGTTPTWLAVQMGNLLPADHQNYAPGQVQISRGGDQLLIDAGAVENVYGDDSLGLRALSQFGNIVAVDDRGALDPFGFRLQDTPFCMGIDYGTPGVVINNYEGAADHSYLNGDYHAAYSYSSDPGAGGPASELTRQVVYLRPGYIIVYDRVTTTQANYDKQQRWNFSQPPTLNGNAFVETVGASKLFGQTFSTLPLTTSLSNYTVGSGAQAFTVQRVTTQNTTTSAAVRFVTAFQVSNSSTSAMDPTAHLESTDGRMEGVSTGAEVVLFGRNGNVDLSTSVQYQLGANSGLSHLLTNLQPDQAYDITVNGTALTTATASAQGTLEFTTPAAGSTMTVAVGTHLSGQVTAQVSGGILHVTATSSADVTLRLKSGASTTTEVVSGSTVIGAFANANFSQIGVQLSSGNDILRIDAGSGNPIPAGGMTCNGGAGTDTLVGPNSINNWSITAANGGTLNTTTTFTNVENLVGGTGADSFVLGSSGSMSGLINGAAGSDTVKGKNSANTWTLAGPNAGTLTGGITFSNVEVLAGGTSTDSYLFNTNTPLGSVTINDAGGIDTLNLSATSLAINLNLSRTTPQTINTNLTLTLTAANVENVTGGSGNDSLSGNSLNNILTGAAGNDIYAFDTDSVQGNDTISESTGIDTLTFAATTTKGVAVNLGIATAQVVNSNLTLTLGSASTLDYIVGGTLADKLTGNSLNNILNGQAGNDTYFFDSDTALGNDTISESGVGIDSVNFSSTTTRGVAVSLRVATAQVVNSNLTLTLGSVSTIENVVGGTLNDNLTGNSLNNTFSGLAGNDTYIFDTDSALGNDTITESGVGKDALDFSGTTTKAVAVNLGLATAQVVNSNLTLTLGSASTMENVVGGMLNDTLTGNSLNNILTGAAGNDIYAFDTDSAQGNDTISESTGIDTLTFAATTTKGVAVNLGIATAQVVNSNLTLTLGSASSLENVVGGSSDDILTGNSRDNILNGQAGDDSYFFDTDSALGNDTIAESGAGIDTLNFAGTTTKGVAVNLAIATAQVVNSNLTLTLGSASTLENVLGGSLNDTLTGNSLNNVLSGNAGNDSISGGAGRDILIGGAGADTLSGGNDEDVLLGALYSQANNVIALNALMAEWGRTDLAYQQRIDHLSSANTSGANNDPFYLTTTGGSPTVTNDAAVDRETGNAALDWFFRRSGEDNVTDQGTVLPESGSEIISAIP